MEKNLNERPMLFYESITNRLFSSSRVRVEYMTKLYEKTMKALDEYKAKAEKVLNKQKRIDAIRSKKKARRARRKAKGPRK